jgi:hypothetical protein
MANTSAVKPGLFGLENTNRDFTKKDFWGKNQFNSSFPAALACYMGQKGLQPIYLCLNNQKRIAHSQISVEQLFGLRQLNPNLYFAFETVYSAHSTLAIGSVPRADLVTFNKNSDPPLALRALEVKLTALPDNTTCTLSDENYGSEIVVRPDTIVYLALGVADTYKGDRKTLLDRLDPVCSRVGDWEEIGDVQPHIGAIADALDDLLLPKLERQEPFMMQPIWKTIGKSGVLHEQCFDMFIWSDLGFTRLFTDTARRERTKPGITRNARSVVWLAKMLHDFALKGSMDFQQIINRYTYNTKNDKAFAVSGQVTNPFMSCAELTTPRVDKNSIKEIILGGGQKFLSPERRLDAAILNTPGLFDHDPSAGAAEDEAQ